MTFPTFYDAQRVGQLYIPNTAEVLAQGQAARLSPASDDTHRVFLILIDAQVDFVHAEGALSVPGAVDDTRRTIEWIFNNLGKITTIAASLDSHLPNQIFYPTWWVNAYGNPPAPFTTITSTEVQNGAWRPVYEPAWSVEYVQKLETQAKKTLMIWPYHTMVGTPGHTITPALYETILYHAAVRQTQPEFLIKGTIPQTEHYSILEPEVKVPNVPLGQLNATFLEAMKTYDEIYIAGQAKSHCVLETVTSMMNYFDSTPSHIERIRLLSDCTSSVAHPEINFEEIATRVFADYAVRGLKLTSSTVAI